MWLIKLTSDWQFHLLLVEFNSFCSTSLTEPSTFDHGLQLPRQSSQLGATPLSTAAGILRLTAKDRRASKSISSGPPEYKTL